MDSSRMTLSLRNPPLLKPLPTLIEMSFTESETDHALEP